MKHFVKKHTHHFGLWALSGLLLIWSIIWLNNLNQETAQSAATKTTEMKSSKILPRFAPQDDNKMGNSPLSDENKNSTPASSSAENQNPIQPTILDAETLSTPEKQTISITFKIITPAATKEFITQVPPQSTVYEAMNELSKQIPVKFKQFSAGLGAFVEEIDGLANDSKTNLFWIYYINGQAAKLGVSSIKLNPNDIITWQYEQAKY